MAGTVREVPVPLPHPALPDADWADGWQTKVAQPFGTARQAAEAITEAFPSWTLPMLALRQIIVLPLGLKGAGAAKADTDMILIFPVVGETPTRLVAGFDDRHLDFRIVVDLDPAEDGQLVTLSTVIRRHNLSGKIYLQLVLPFHRAIIGGALRRLSA